MKTASLILAAAVLSTATYACYEQPYTPGTSRDDLSEEDEKDKADDDDDDDDEADKKVDEDASEPAPAESKPGPKKETDPEPTETAPPPPPAANAFTNASPYVEVPPGDETKRHHGANTNAGKDCMLCHGAGGGAPRFAFGGTVYTAQTGAPAVQVRIVDSTGNEIALVGTDAAGNFWLPGNATIPPGSKVAVRKGTTVKAMNATIGTGACNQSGCHNANRPITL